MYKYGRYVIKIKICIPICLQFQLIHLFNSFWYLQHLLDLFLSDFFVLSATTSSILDYGLTELGSELWLRYCSIYIFQNSLNLLSILTCNGWTSLLNSSFISFPFSLSIIDFMNASPRFIQCNVGQHNLLLQILTFFF